MKTPLFLLLAGLCVPPALALSPGDTAHLQGAADHQDTAPAPDPDGEEKPAAVRAMRLEAPIVVDGVLDEGAWAQAPAIDGFRQRDPVEGAAPTQRTVVHVLYDDEALYVGVRLYDTSPDSIVARLGRRDAALEADRFGVFIDPYNDNRSGYYFAVNAAGTLYDGVLMNDDWDDDSWDGVWQARVRIGDEGWTAEMRIPYSQLRFLAKETHAWGINFRRDIARRNERDYLVYTPRNESGFVSRFPDLVGVERIRPPRQVEVTPYVTAQARYTGHEPGDPFNDGSRYTPDLGADVKVGLTSNLTLNASVNPDFGQVEVDPAVVNLSDRETFYEEKRPFFVEGATVFNFGYGGANDNWGFNWGNPDFFYSRRIGRPPQGSTPDADFTDRPDGTPILGAAKLTGRVADWNVGMVHALTARSWAELMQGGLRSEVEVEPRAYYGVVRVQRELNDGRQGLGLLSTAAARGFDGPRLREEINDAAYVVGLDGWTFLDRARTWVVNGWAGMSHVRGTEARMLALQQSALHYFQRPDASHVRVDSSATSLTGLAGRVALNKQRGSFYVNTAFGFVTPSFDVNDVGFQWRGDALNGHFVAGYRWMEPRSFYRNIQVYSALFQSFDFDGNPTWGGVFGRTGIEFKNYYFLNLGFAHNPPSVNNSRTRGGPLMRNPPGTETFFYAHSDGRRPWVVSVQGFTYRSEQVENSNLQFTVEWKPAANVSVSLNPSVSWTYDPAQWIGAFDDPLATATYGRRYVFGELEQTTLSSSVRLNWTFTPQLSLQLYAQPFLSVGSYARYKELARPKSFAFDVYGEGASTVEASASSTFTADPDGPGPAPAFSFDDPNFNFKSLRGTAVLRWEYRAGSTLYLVWTQQRSDSETIGTFNLANSMGRLWDAQPDNIFMVKLNYWLSR